MSVSSSNIRSGRLLRQRWRQTLLLVACLSLGACSGTQFLYERLDFLLPWYVDDYVELDRDQDEFLEQALKPFLAWHRYRELPRYAQVLAEAQRQLDAPVDAESLEQLMGGVEAAVERLQRRSLDWALPLGERLSEAQIREFIANLEKSQKDYEEEYLGRDEQRFREHSYERLLDSCEDYLGRLDRSQRETLHRTAARMKRYDRVWLEERAQWIVRLEQLLERRPGWQRGVREALASRWEHSSEEYRSVYAHNLALIQGALATVINGRSERQDQRLRRRLARLEQDLLALNQRGHPPGDTVSALSL